MVQHSGAPQIMDISNNHVRLIETKRFEDPRGWFVETYSARHLAALGIDVRFVQDNHSFSRLAGTVRGLHFQLPPHGQTKLVRCIRGAIFDVAVDVRRESPTYGQWVGAEISAANQRQLFIPVGFAHGFATLEPDTEVLYKTDSFYAPNHEAGIVWDDPTLAIDWRLPAGVTATMSAKDEALAPFSTFTSPFPYDGHPLEPLGV
jgi:dTDP-4-dehydrorhamnose 3,5-epimerase